MKKLFKVAVNDFRLVFRDNSLKIFIVLPLLNLAVIRWGVPYLAGVYDVLRDYVNIILMLATLQGSVAFGFIYAMVLVDEKDTSAAKVYGILPVSKFWFTAFRLLPPFFLAALAAHLLLLVEPFYDPPFIPNLAYSALAGMSAPVSILFTAVIAKNKIEAMTWQKLFNLPLYLPVAAFFVPASFSFVLAVFPTFWTFQGFDRLIEGGNFRAFIFIGFAHNVLLIAFLIRRFTGNHFK